MAKAQYLGNLSSFKSSEGKDGGLQRHIEGVKDLKKGDRAALSNALVRKGEFYLLHGDKLGLAFFNIALKLSPSNVQLYVNQGLALFEYGSLDGNEKELALASKRFKTATTLDASCFEAWHLWGNTLYCLGMRKDEPSYFSHACKKYDEAIACSYGQPSDVLADLYWDYGDLWTRLAEISKEASDYHTAIKAYIQATTFQDSLPVEFWVNFAHASLVLGEKISNLALFMQAIHCYKNVLSIDVSLGEGWFKLAHALHRLYDYTHEEDHFSQAGECYSTATHLLGPNKQIYLEWARLLLQSGTIFLDTKRLRSCIEKCHCANRCDENDPYVIGVWSEALALLGSLTDQIGLIHNAQNKIEPLIDELHDPEIYYSYGMVLTAMGEYYKDSDYYYQSIEAFQEGLSLNCTCHKLWYAMGNSSFAAALIDYDEKNYDRAHHFFQRALNFEVSSTYQCHYAIFLLQYGVFLQKQSFLELAVHYFEQALSMQKNAFYVHPNWIFHFASALDHLAGFTENDSHYVRSLDLLSHILALKPEFPHIHYQLAIVYSHYAGCAGKIELLYQAIHHYRIANQQEEDNDQIMLDWSLALIHLGNLVENSMEADQYFREAEYKMIRAAKLGNVFSYYPLASLYSLTGALERSIYFLRKAKHFDGLPPIAEIREDTWLDNVKKTEEFSLFLAELEADVE